MNDMQELVNIAEMTASAIENGKLVWIVRCKDCKHGEPCNDGEIYCKKDVGTIETAVHKPDWFCADGERKE